MPIDVDEDQRREAIALATLAVSTEPEDLLLPTLRVEMLSSAHTTSEGIDHEEPRASRQEPLEAFVSAGVRDAGLAADVLPLPTRDCYVSTVEEPFCWTRERAARVARVVVDALGDS
jgi:hypothetical protein